MDTYTQQELLAKTNATAIIVEINNRFCVNCHKPHINCKAETCFWKKVIMETRELYKI